MDQQQSKPITRAPQRLYDLDNFRTYLTALVIYHHNAVPYGGSGGWKYKSQFHTTESSPPLIAFNTINQTYFMGSFFLLSGYFSSTALRRKGTAGFLSMKFFKLGLPTLVFTLFGDPAQVALLRLYNDQSVGWDALLNSWKSLRGVRGPVWYLALVLIFDTLYAFAPFITTYTSKFQFLPTFVINVTADFLIRLLYPVGSVFAPLNLQPAYLPQYIITYFLGASLSSSPNPPLTTSTRNNLIASSLLSAITAISLLYLYPSSYTIESGKGGFNLLALLYAIWNESTGYLIGTLLLRLFRSRNLLRRRWANVSKHSYGAFLVHPIVCVGIQVWSDGWKANGVLKTVVLGTVGVIGSWGR